MQELRGKNGLVKALMNQEIELKRKSIESTLEKIKILQGYVEQYEKEIVELESKLRTLDD